MYFGIDPGINGGIAYIDEEKGTYGAFPLPITITKKGKRTKKELNIRKLLLLFDRMIEESHSQSPIVVTIEKVSAMPNQGVVSMFNFGYTFGVLVAVANVITTNIYLVRPQAWKKELLGIDHTKQGAIDYCNRNFPNAKLVLPRCRKPHDGMADALCLAKYAKETYE